MGQTVQTPEWSAVAKQNWQKIQICTKQPRNLQKILGGYRDKQSVPVDAGCSKCDKKCKVSCPMMQEGNILKVEEQEKHKK